MTDNVAVLLHVDARRELPGELGAGILEEEVEPATTGLRGRRRRKGTVLRDQSAEGDITAIARVDVDDHDAGLLADADANVGVGLAFPPSADLVGVGGRVVLAALGAGMLPGLATARRSAGTRASARDDTVKREDPPTAMREIERGGEEVRRARSAVLEGVAKGGVEDGLGVRFGEGR